MDPGTLAAELGVAPKTLRTCRRDTYQRPEATRDARWVLDANRSRQHGVTSMPHVQRPRQQHPGRRTRDRDSDLSKLQVVLIA